MTTPRELLRRATVGALAAAVASAAAACSRPAEAPRAAAPAATPPPPAVELSTDRTGTIVGRVPASGTAVVVLEPATPRDYPPQSEKPVMDQVGLTFGPELLIVRTGQPVEFRNNDDTLHNVNVRHEETREQAFNVAIPTGGSYEHTFTRDGFYRVGCDIHPAMAASIFAASTPYATVAQADGRFTFADVPAGPWAVTVYTGGKQLRKAIDVKRGVTQVTVE